jgi:hypothetical protein
LQALEHRLPETGAADRPFHRCGSEQIIAGQDAAFMMAVAQARTGFLRKTL